MAWLLSGTSAVMLWMMGNKSRYAPWVGLGNQVLWTFYAVSTKQWGLLPGVILYAVIHARNAWKWNRKEALQ